MLETVIVKLLDTIGVVFWVLLPMVFFLASGSFANSKMQVLTSYGSKFQASNSFYYAHPPVFTVELNLSESANLDKACL